MVAPSKPSSRTLLHLVKPHVFPFEQPLPAPSAPSAGASQEPPLLIRLVPSHMMSSPCHDVASSASLQALYLYACRIRLTTSLIFSPTDGDTGISIRTPSLLVRLTKGGVLGRIFNRTIEGSRGIRPVARYALAIFIKDIASLRAA